MGEAQPAVATAVAAARVVEVVQVLRRAPALARQQVTTCGHCSQSMCLDRFVGTFSDGCR